VPTAESEHHDTPDSADTCWRPCGKNNTGTPYTVEDRGNGGLALPAVHQSDTVGLPVPGRAGSPMTGLQTWNSYRSGFLHLQVEEDVNDW